MLPAETKAGVLGAFAGLSGATGSAGPAKGVAIGDGFGCGEGTDDGNGEAEVVGGDAAGSGLAAPGVCAVAKAATPLSKTGTSIPESWRRPRRFKRSPWPNQPL